MHCSDSVLYVLVFNVSCTIQHSAAICNKPFVITSGHTFCMIQVRLLVIVRYLAGRCRRTVTTTVMTMSMR